MLHMRIILGMSYKAWKFEIKDYIPSCQNDNISFKEISFEENVICY